ncbi:hypothetical protein U0070_024345 [Myodes glareolus]|uniref:Uncharacterized protein n=1 Tax=Myodes glareolus TaxID=447135 RepID=A0AAW0IKS7_MYOGA
MCLNVFHISQRVRMAFLFEMAQRSTARQNRSLIIGKALRLVRVLLALYREGKPNRWSPLFERC